MERDPSLRIMQYRSFVDVWHKCIPEVQFMTPRTDVCTICEKFCCNIKAATAEEDKLSLTEAFSAHLRNSSPGRAQVLP